MRLVLILFVFLGMASPAAADAPIHLQSLERQLRTIEASNPGNVGIAALDLATGDMVAVHGEEAFPMASTVKIAIAAQYLAQVEYGRRSLDTIIGGRPARKLLEVMIINSDNLATDIILRDLGGPAKVHRWLKDNDIKGLRVDRNIAQLLAARRDLFDERDSSTPKAMVQWLQRIDSGTLIKPASRAYLLGLMSRCATGKNRIRGFLPAGVKVENKTGTLSGLTSDVGFLTLPDGRRIAVALFARSGTNRPQAIARAARAIYDSFSITRFASFGGSSPR
jgi:beta-lactamase class A